MGTIAARAAEADRKLASDRPVVLSRFHGQNGRSRGTIPFRIYDRKQVKGMRAARWRVGGTCRQAPLLLAMARSTLPSPFTSPTATITRFLFTHSGKDSAWATEVRHDFVAGKGLHELLFTR